MGAYTGLPMALSAFVTALLLPPLGWLAEPGFATAETEAPEPAWQARDQPCCLARCLAAMKALCGT